MATLAGSSTAAIIVTSARDAQTTALTRSARRRAFLVKPFGLDKLLQAVAQLIGPYTQPVQDTRGLSDRSGQIGSVRSDQVVGEPVRRRLAAGGASVLVRRCGKVPPPHLVVLWSPFGGRYFGARDGGRASGGLPKPVGFRWFCGANLDTCWHSSNCFIRPRPLSGRKGFEVCR